MKNKLKQNQASLGTGSSMLSSKRQSQERSRRFSFNKPTPLDFDAFVPWVCLEWQLPDVVMVTRMIQEEYKKCDRRSFSSRSKSTNKSLKFKQDDFESTNDVKKNVATSTPAGTDFMSISDVDNVIRVKAHYDTRGHLVEVSIIGCPYEIHRKVIQAFSICIPFHSLFTKLTIRRGGLTNPILHEIGKMLPHSNLTDVCLDDCIVPEGKYDAIFEQTSQLKYLSLNRCSIDNTTCKALAAKIDFGCPGSTLLILELGSNLISDKGAKALGESLRRNRRLLHLNLSGNNITDAGASPMLSHLMEYKLTWDEIVDARQRKLKYTEKKMEVYAQCYEEVLKRQRSEILAGSGCLKKPLKSKSFKNEKEDYRKKTKKGAASVFVEEKSPADIAVALTMDVVGKFNDPYDENSVVKRDEHSHSKGNMVLCSLNLAYNNLSFVSITKIHEVLKYQDRMTKSSGATGLLRVVLEGNYIPTYCVEYDKILMFLKKAVIDNAPIDFNVQHKKRTSSAPASRRS